MSHGAHEHFVSAGHESDGTSVPAVLAFGALIVILVLGAIALEALHLNYFQHSRPDRVAANTADVSNLPERVGAWVKPGEDLAAMREQEQQHLSTYGWIDQKAGVVRIPIKRAMDLMAPPAGAEQVRSK